MARKGKVTVNPEHCKGCNICVAFCPKKVLALEKNVAVPANPEECIACRMCEMRCPEYAISVEVVNDHE